MCALDKLNNASKYKISYEYMQMVEQTALCYDISGT